MKALELIKPVNFVPPGPWAMKTLCEATGRTMSLSNLQKHDQLCVWCNSNALPTKRHRWCGPDCVQTGQIWCYPQDPMSKAYVFIERQNCACLYCGRDYTDLVEQKIEKHYKRNLNRQKELERMDMAHKKYGYGQILVTYGQIGYGTGHVLHVDHIIPIHKGGQGIGLDNIQVICVDCHKHKTAQEARREDVG